MAREDFKAFVSRSLALATSQYRDAVSTDIKNIAKQMFAGDPSFLHRDWTTADPFQVLPALQRQASVTVVQPQEQLVQQFQGIRMPVTMPQPGPIMRDPYSYNAYSAFNPESPTQFPPLGATATSSKKKHQQPLQQPQFQPQPPPPAAVEQPTPVTKKQKKRKAAQLAMPGELETEEERLALAKRAHRFEREREIEQKREMGMIKDESDEEGSGHGQGRKLGSGRGRMGRLGRIQGYGHSGDTGEDPEADPNVINWDKFTIRGTNTQIEKSYLRLTSAPNPAMIRPLNILEKTLGHLKERWLKDRNYPWICDQFKSMRQDLTVQRIKNGFTVNVYENHARFALQSGDLGEYNQCQSVLKQLYEHGLPGKAPEFLSYRILYMLHTKNMAELGRTISRLSSALRKEPGISHALQVHTAISTGNYHQLFKLYHNAPNMSAYMMDQFVERERAAALVKISKAYMTLPLTFLANQLGYLDPPEILDLCDLLTKHRADTYTSPTALRVLARTSELVARNMLVSLESFQEIIWNCKTNAPACERMLESYKGVDIKGQK